MRELKYGRHHMVLGMLPPGVGGLRVDELARECACSKRTVERDLAMLQSVGYPVESERTARGKVWRLAAGFHRQAPVPFSTLEAVALVMAREHLRAAGDAFFGDLLDGLLGKLRAGRGRDMDRLARSLKESFVGVGGMTAAPPLRGNGLSPGARAEQAEAGWYEAIVGGIRNRLKLEIDYQDSSGRITKARRVAPLRFWLVERNTYLIAWCDRKKEIRTFLMSRVKKLAATKVAFDPMPDLDPDQYAAEAFGGFHGPVEPVALLFDSMLEDYLRHHPLHPSQAVEARGGEVHATLSVCVNESFIHRLLGFGARVRVESPRRLADTLARRHAQAADTQAKYLARRRDPDATEPPLPLVFE